MCDLTLEEFGYVIFGHMDKYNALSLEREKIFRSIIIDTDSESRSNKRKRYDELTQQLEEIDKRFNYWTPILRKKGINLNG